MDWRGINFDWNRSKAFLVTCEEKSFSAAAKALNLTQSTLSRQVAALEKELGVVLFERVGKGIEITPTGLELAEYVKEMAKAADKISLIVNGKSMDITGRVVITASEVISALILPTFIQQIRSKHPGLTIEIVASNDSKDLRRREADIAIRNQTTEHPNLTAKKVTSFIAHLYASKSYINKYGPFRDKESLRSASFIGMPDNTRWINVLSGMGIEVNESNFPIVSDNHLVHWNVIKQGMAIGAMPEIAINNDNNVEKVLPDLPGIPIQTWVVAHRELRTSNRIRFVFDSLVEYLNQLNSAMASAIKNNENENQSH